MAEQIFGLTGDAFRRTRDAVRRVEGNPIGGPGYEAKTRDHRPPPPESFRTAQITAEDSDGYYEAEEVVWDDSADEWITKSGGITWDGGSAPNQPKIYEINGTTGIAVDRIVQVFNAIGDEGEVLPVFLTPLPSGVGEGKVLQLDATATTGVPFFDYPRFTA